MYPGLRSLRMADGNKPAMVYSYHLTHRTTTAINKSVGLLNNEDLIVSSTDGDDLAREEEEVYGEGKESDAEEEGGDDKEIEIEDEDEEEGEEGDSE